jgi:hypothetical protein
MCLKIQTTVNFDYSIKLEDNGSFTLDIKGVKFKPQFKPMAESDASLKQLLTDIASGFITFQNDQCIKDLCYSYELNSWVLPAF